MAEQKDQYTDLEKRISDFSTPSTPQDKYADIE